MIVTGHQINFLPGMSVMEKVRAADVVIWLDQVQYSRNGFTNRNRIDESWMTVPVASRDTFAPINRVHIIDPTFRYREKIARTLAQHLGGETAFPYGEILARPYGLLVGLNWALLQRLMADLGMVDDRSVFQSHLDAGHALPIWSDDETELRPARERLADMVAEIGGTTWLSGPSGRHYLNEAPFRERGIKVEYFDWAGPNPSAIATLAGTRSTIRA